MMAKAKEKDEAVGGEYDTGAQRVDMRADYSGGEASNRNRISPGLRHYQSLNELADHEDLLEYKDLRNDPKFIAYALENSWEQRYKLGFSRNSDVFEFVKIVYKRWLGKGIVQSDLKADLGLYRQFQKTLSLRRTAELPIPDWIAIDLPAEKDARMAALETEHEKKLLADAREGGRARAAIRSLSNGPT